MFFKKRKNNFHRFSDTYPDTRRLLAHREVKPHLVFHDGSWKLFRSWWKCAWTLLNPSSSAAYISGKTIPDLRFHLSRCKDKRFGG